MKVSPKVVVLFFAPLVAAVVVLGLFGQEAQEPTARQFATPSAELSSRLVKTAAERWRIVEQQVRSNEASIDEAIRAASELLNARLGYPDSTSRQTILREHAERLTLLKGFAEKAYEAGKATQPQLLAVEAELLKAQLLVESGVAEAAAKPSSSRPQTIEQPGQLEASQQVSVYTRIAGVVEKVHVVLGDRVKKGQVLAELSVPEARFELKRKEAEVALAHLEVERALSAIQAAEAVLAAVQAQVAEAEAGVQGGQANYERRKVELERLQQLRANGAITAESVDEARSQLKAAEAALATVQAKLQVAQATVQQSKAQVAQAKAEVTAAQTRLELAVANRQQAEAQVDHAHLKAPFDGVVSRHSAAVGAFTPAATSGVAEPLFVVIQTDPIRVVVAIPEADAVRVSNGTPALVLIPAGKGQKLPTRVTRVGAVIDPATRTLRVELELPNPEGKLRPGTYATVVLSVEDSTGPH